MLELRCVVYGCQVEEVGALTATATKYGVPRPQRADHWHLCTHTPPAQHQLELSRQRYRLLREMQGELR